MLAAQRAAAAKLILANQISRMLVFHCLECFNEWGVVARSEDISQQCTLATTSLPLVVVQLFSYQVLEEVDVKTRVYLGEA